MGGALERLAAFGARTFIQAVSQQQYWISNAMRQM
jgi:hypothetical protein